MAQITAQWQYVETYAEVKSNKGEKTGENGEWSKNDIGYGHSIDFQDNDDDSTL